MHRAGIAVVYGALLLLITVTGTNSTKCTRFTDDVTGPPSSAKGKYHFFVTLYNRTEVVSAYMPNTRYSVVLRADSSEQQHRKFTRFLVSAEFENVNETNAPGAFDLQDDALTKFADNCANTIVETSMVQKEEVSIAWTSPTEGSGCVLLRAMVMETPDTWYTDDLDLIINICQDIKAEADDQGMVLPECCACDEAKYEVTFEGLWSRNTHPKDFPSKSWLIRFSDVIGASHSGDYRFWQYNDTASIGLRQVAELGATRKLESELKEQSEHIRTIIKARGISYPNVTGKTFAVFRVDRKHHLMSLVSMIDPSPDWFLGVSGLELCLVNCSWIEHKELNLYPYDAGTDNGITYLSPDSPTQPPESIRRITSTYPNNSESPFYDPSGLDMKPLAKLYLNRQRLYEKTCDEPNETQADREACKVTHWGEWTACSVTCGRGNQLRQRRFENEILANANKCDTLLTDRITCYNAQSPYCTNGRYDGILDSDMCALSNWSRWSKCSSTCGEGSKTRSRYFEHKKYRKQCMAVPNKLTLQQTMDCENKPCEDEDAEEVRKRWNLVKNDTKNEDYDEDGESAEGTGELIEEWLQKCPRERYTKWSMWSPCSSSCGPGFKLRSRKLDNNWSSLGKEDDEDIHDEECKLQQASCMAEIVSCDFTKEEAEKICSEPMEKGRCNSNILRTYFNKQAGRCHWFSYSGCDGNRNNFQNEQDCNKVCGSFQKKEDFHGIQASNQIMESSENRVDCQVSEWGEWTRCESCRGFTTSIRSIMVSAKGGGKSCPKKLLRKKKCHRNRNPPCFRQNDGTGRRSYRDKSSRTNDEISVHCKVTPWSMWSRCSATCGKALRNRVRRVMVQPRGPWAKLCPVLAEYRECRPVKDCPQD